MPYVKNVKTLYDTVPVQLFIIIIIIMKWNTAYWRRNATRVIITGIWNCFSLPIMLPLLLPTHICNASNFNFRVFSRSSSHLTSPQHTSNFTNSYIFSYFSSSLPSMLSSLSSPSPPSMPNWSNKTTHIPNSKYHLPAAGCEWHCVYRRRLSGCKYETLNWDDVA